MSKLKFYSAEELQTLSDELNSGKTIRNIAREYSAKWNRPKTGLTMKLYSIKNNNIRVSKITPVKVAQSTKIEAGVELPSGFVFDFQPKRAEMYANHVRLYF
jgi:hypothetical protein